MQDNELDNLFRSKLDDFETEPSANVWQNIDAGLTPGNRRRLLVPLLSAAASIIVLVVAGVLLLNQPVKVAMHQHKRDLVKTTVPVKATSKPYTGKIIAAITQVKPVKKSNLLKQIVKQQPVVKSQNINLVAVQQPVMQQVRADVTQKHNTTIPAQRKDTVILIADNQTSLPVSKPVQAVIPDKQIETKPAIQPTKKHRIHSLGDMLNTVIAAVDKRKDKLIEFTDTDDDESVITGVNLGIVAVKKQN